jgi:hypothetical protein
MGAIVIRTRYDEGTESAEAATSGFAPKKAVVTRFLLFTSHKYCYVTSFIQDRCHCQSKQSLPSVSQVGGDLQLVAE